MEYQKTVSKLNTATIRIHGTVDTDNLKEAATLFLKKAELQKKEGVKEWKKSSFKSKQV